MFDKIASSKWKHIVMYITVFAFVATSLVAILIYKFSGEINGVAEVNGREIPFYHFNYAYEMATRNLQAQNIDPTQFKKEIVKEVIDDLIQTELIYQEAEKEGLVATFQQVKEEILNIPAFQVNGKFDKQLYIQTINSLGLSPEGFEEILRKELTVNNVRAILLSSLYVSDDEVETFTKKQLTNISGEVTLIKPKEPIITDQQIKDYYEKHKKDYASSKDKKIVVYRIDIQKLGEDKAQAVAKESFTNLKSGKPVSPDAEKLYEDTLTNIKSKTDLPSDLISGMESLSENKDILFLKNGNSYYIAKYLGEVYQETPFESVKESIARKLKEEQTQKAIEELQKSNQTLVDLLKNNQTIRENVDNITLQELIVKYGIKADDSGKILNLKLGQTSTPINVREGIMIFNLTGISQPDKNKVEEMKKSILPLVKNQKFNDIYRMYVDKLKEKAKIKINKRILENG
ncbi:MAG: SurA N-terminal domain-containing protein [Hydrogenothermaceae bacterium]|nr:SurA N-terminal domain-containing protein [Hydrogenothermaceae bacterium]